MRWLEVDEFWMGSAVRVCVGITRKARNENVEGRWFSHSLFTVVMRRSFVNECRSICIE